MKNVIVGTAGHIDHGKTWLIRALTGIDADRLKEEKQRGITIELGFADMKNDRGIDIGIIDVPGHEKFVRHMLAGVGGMDLVLLVIAADEGIMPQTREHFGILKMLEIDKGIVVLTKKDLVDDEWLELVKEDVQDYVKGTFLEGAPVIAVSSETGENIDVLKEMILDMAGDIKERRTDKSLLRLPADRVFTMEGFGVVITGTLMEGAVAPGDEVSIYPEEIKAKVKNVQVHGKDVKEAFAGQRTALNLNGVRKEDIRRGDVITAPGLLEKTRLLDVQIDMFEDTKRVLKNGSRVHFYYGSAETICKVVLLEQDTLSQGQSGLAQLRFDEEIAVKRNDRFILRFFSPMETIAGGFVLNASPRKHKRFDEEAVKIMRRQAGGDEKTALEQLLLTEGKRLADLGEVLKLFGSTGTEAEHLLEELREEGTLTDIGGGILLHADTVKEIAGKANEILGEYHRENPVISGMMKEEFRSRFGRAMHVSDGKRIDTAARYLISSGAVCERNGLVSQPGFKVVYDDKQQKIAEDILLTYEKAGVEPPETKAFVSEKKNSREYRQIVDSLAESGELTRLNQSFCIHSGVLMDAMQKLEDILEKDGKVTLAEYRDIIGTSRKYAMMILEYADNNKVTRLVGDVRVKV